MVIIRACSPSRCRLAARPESESLAMKKKTLLYFVVPVVCCIVLLAAMVGYILTDAPLTPMAEKALRHQPPPMPPTENAFVGIMGLNAPAGRDFILAGVEEIRRINQNFAKQEPEKAPQETLAFRSNDDKLYFCDQEITETCLEDIQSAAQNIHQLLEKNEVLIARYLKIQAMPKYSNEITADFGSNSDFMTISRLLSAHAVLEIGDGRIREGLDFFEKNMAFYRNIITSPEINFLDLMLASDQTRRHAILLALLVRKGWLSGEEADRARALLTPLPAPDAAFANARWREQVFLMKGFSTMDQTPKEMAQMEDLDSGEVRDGSYLQILTVTFLFKKNMSLNLQSEFHEAEMSLIRASSPAQLRDMREEGWEDEIHKRVCTVPKARFYCRHWKNFVGEILSQIALGHDIEFLLRVHDADAYLRLLRAQLEFQRAMESLQDKNKDKGTPEEILARLGPETFNPYTQKPFAWNAKRKTIGFMPGHPRDRKKRREVRLDFPAP
jgi:hypothetical protein